MTIRKYSNSNDLILDILGIKSASAANEQNPIIIDVFNIRPSDVKDLITSAENGGVGSLGECADILMNIKTDRAKLTRQDNELKMYAGVLKDHILECLEKEGLTSSSGKEGCVTIGVTNRFSISDKETFLKHILETEAFDLIGTAVSAPAMNSRVLEGEEVPGVKCFEQTQIKLTKRKV